MNTRVVLVGILSAAAIALGCQSASTAAPPRQVIRITNSSSLVEPLAAEYQRRLSDVTISVVGDRRGARWLGLEGTTNTAQNILDGNAEVGVGSADVAYSAYLNASKRKDGQSDRLRGIAVLPATPLQLIVRRNGGIESPADLRRRHVRLGAEGAPLAGLVLESLGLTDRDLRVSTMPESTRSPAAAAALAAGEVDAVFVSGHYPVESVRLAAEHEGRVVPLVGSEIDRLRERYPFIRSLTIPAGTYPHQPQAIETIGIDVVLFCRGDLDEDLVYRLTREFFHTLTVLRDVQPSLRLLDVDHAPATPFPLHSGAIRYYREWELFR